MRTRSGSSAAAAGKGGREGGMTSCWWWWRRHPRRKQRWYWCGEVPTPLEQAPAEFMGVPAPADSVDTSAALQACRQLPARATPSPSRTQLSFSPAHHCLACGDAAHGVEVGEGHAPQAIHHHDPAAEGAQVSRCQQCNNQNWNSFRSSAGVPSPWSCSNQHPPLRGELAIDGGAGGHPAQPAALQISCKLSNVLRLFAEVHFFEHASLDVAHNGCKCGWVKCGVVTLDARDVHPHLHTRTMPTAPPSAAPT